MVEPRQLRYVVPVSVRILALLLALVGCAEERERPANVGNCPPEQPNCATIPPKHGGGGAAGTGGGGGSGAATNAELSGTVLGVVADDFVSSVAFIGTATVEAYGPASATLTTAYDGQVYAFPSIPKAPEVWLRVAPDAPGVFVSTLQPVNTETTAQANLLVVSGSVLDETYALATLPEVRELGRAQLVLRFVDGDTNQPLAGVSVAHQGEVVLYDVAGTWSDLQGVTGDGGYAVVVNAAAQSFVAKQKVTFQLGSSLLGSVEVAVRADTVTLADVVLEL